MKKIISLFLLLSLILSLYGCYETNVAVTVCKEEIEHHYWWEYDRYRHWETYPRTILHGSLNIPSLSFDDCYSFYKKIRDMRFSSEELNTLQDTGKLISHTHENDLPGIPNLSAIQDLLWKSQATDLTVKWFGCSDYVLEGEIEIQGITVPIRMRHYGFENFKNSVPSNAEHTATEGDVPMDRYHWLDTNQAYKRIASFYTVTSGDYRYRVAERELYDCTQERDGQLLMRQYDIEIYDGSNYYYVFLGYLDDSPCPTLTPEIVKSFTLKSFD